jgi:RNA polymerase sigma-70 factor (ECF subfamily)
MREISQDVLKKASQGDIQAFEEVYNAAGSLVYNVALRITRNSADAEEVAQDVFMKIYHSLKDFQFRSSFKTWIYRIAVNTAINRYRKSARERNGMIDYDNAVESFPASGSTADSAIRNDNEARLNGLLGMLSLDHRTCLVLREIQGLSYGEIAVSLKIPVNTVRSRLKRARQALLERVKQGEVDKDALR